MPIPDYPDRFRVAGIGDVSFMIRAENTDGGQLTDWSMPSNIVTHVVPGSFPPVVVNDLISHGPSTASWRVRIPTRADYRRLLLMRGQVGELVVLGGLQGHDGTAATIDNVQYERLPDTTLLDVGRAVQIVDQEYEAEVTFQRVFDPATAFVSPEMLANFEEIGAGVLSTPPQLRTPDDEKAFTMSGTVRATTGPYPNTRAVRLNASDSAYLNTPDHGLIDEIGVVAVRCRWRSSGEADVMRIGNVATDGVRIWRTAGGVVTGRAGGTNLTGPTMATDEWTDVILRWALGSLWLWVDGALVATGSASGTPDVTGNQLIVGSNNAPTRGDVDVDAVATYGSMTDVGAAMLNRSWSWDWYSVMGA